MTLPLGIATKLLQLLQGAPMPASALQHAIISKMVEDGIVKRQQTGRTKALLFVPDPALLQTYIKNQFGVNDLQAYAANYNRQGVTRADAVAISSDSKWRTIRTFRGFLVNAYQPVHATLHGKPVIIQPANGSFTFISDYDAFKVPEQTTIVGVENPENFRHIQQQQYLFTSIQPLFVSRYPQSNDLAKWLQSISNPYLHFGDLDFAGINIYLNEYKRHLGDRASFFIPPGIENMLQQFGNRDLYNRQLSHWKINVEEPGLTELVSLLHKYKKGLEQEVLIRSIC